jgi:diacylglycerol kinase (ATP)
MHLVIIANPVAGRGAARQAAARLEPALRRLGLAPDRVMRWTTSSGDEAQLAHHAIADGATIIGALGGDGTISRVGGAMATAGSGATLLTLPAGTGNDFVKSLAAPAHDHEAMLRLAADGARPSIDVGMVDDTVPFLNAAGFGFDADVVAATAGVHYLSGSPLYAVTALRRLVPFRGVTLALGQAPPRRRVLAAFANGRTFGGAFRIAPTARLDDGLLDAVLVDDASLGRRIALLAAVARGAHAEYREVTHTQAANFSLRFDGPVVYQADGELHRTSSGVVNISTRPRALRVVARD